MSKFKFYVAVVALLLVSPFHSQVKNNNSTRVKAKLIIGIVVDQMRNDYIYRYWDRFGNGGLKRLVTNGYYFKNTHYNYVPTYTGPGHASIYTGATPRVHGIIANDWFIKSNQTFLYCAEDTSVQGIGTKSKSAKRSPRNQLSSTISDELKINSNLQSKVFSIALKDRSAILPAGHTADGAFWLDDASGDFISSSWYMNELPNWVQKFNLEKRTKNYLEKGWIPLYDLKSYTHSMQDNSIYESAPGKKEAVFPYDYSSYLEKQNYSIIKINPFGNTLTFDLAKTCIQSENLGKGTQTDLLCLSFSSTDGVGHLFGIRSVETEDTYLRFDKDLEEFLNFLDLELGKDNYVIFLTADHGGAEVPAYLKNLKIPSGLIHDSDIEKQLKAYFFKAYNDSNFVLNVSNQQVFLNQTLIKDKKLKSKQLENEIAEHLVKINGIAEAFSSEQMKFGSYDLRDFRTLLQNGYNHKLSGDVCFIYEPGWIDHESKGTTHGSGYVYDTHVPLLFFGNGIKKGESYNYTSITQIAPTICDYLKIAQPNGCISNSLLEKLVH